MNTYKDTSRVTTQSR